MKHYLYGEFGDSTDPITGQVAWTMITYVCLNNFSIVFLGDMFNEIKNKRK